MKVQRSFRIQEQRFQHYCPSVIGGNEISDIKRLLLLVVAFAISIGDASEELSLADHIVLALTAAREIGDGGMSTTGMSLVPVSVMTNEFWAVAPLLSVTE